jgi:hypothetical protein
MSAALVLPQFQLSCGAAVHAIQEHISRRDLGYLCAPATSDPFQQSPRRGKLTPVIISLSAAR